MNPINLKMIIKKVLNSLIIASFGLLLISCGEYGKGDASIINGSVGDIVEISPKLSSLEVSFLRSACSRLRAMRMDLQSTTDIESIKFNVVTGACMSNSTTQEVNAQINSPYDSNISFNVVSGQNTGSLLESIAQTDRFGVMANFCQTVFNGGDVDQVYTTYLGQGRVYSFPSDNLFIVNLVIQNNNNENVLVEKYSYTIESNQGATRNALVEKVEYQSACTNNNVKTDTQYVEEYILN